VNGVAGSGNTATGFESLFRNTTGTWNTATGALALHENTTGIWNTATGGGALWGNTTGSYNTATGEGALGSNSTADDNTADGAFALRNNTSGTSNTAVGRDALYANTNGGGNTANGYQALGHNSTSGGNTAIGLYALFNNTTGTNNTALGDQAGFNATTGDNNVYIGAWMCGVPGESNACYIASIFGQTSSGGIPVYINSDGKLGTTTSSRRFKENIKPMNDASEALFDLQPVTFRYKKEIDPQGIPQFGLVAEDVEKVNPKLVVRDKDGKVNTVRYEAVNAMLLNEFLKEHKRLKTQQATITELKSTVAQQQKGMEILTTQLKEQAAQIQRVSAQVEMSKPALRVVTGR
jgi:uncharacterized coiled-coil protein SlyX